METKHKQGARVNVECAAPDHWRTGETVIKTGTIDSLMSAEDRPYRINVTGDHGEYWRACAPECITVQEGK